MFLNRKQEESIQRAKEQSDTEVGGVAKGGQEVSDNLQSVCLCPDTFQAGICLSYLLFMEKA